MIIGLVNQKGGVGKTTLAINMAQCLSRVLVIDADPQQSLLNWLEVRDCPLNFQVIGFAKKTLHRDIVEIAKNYDFVIIDSPPRVTEIARSCIMASDLVIIPCTPSPYDVWASAETVSLVKEAQVYKENLKCTFVINRKIANTAIGRDVKQALFDLTVNIPFMDVADAEICQRIIFAEAASIGKTALEIDPDSLASSEIRALVGEILRSNCNE